MSKTQQAAPSWDGSRLRALMEQGGISTTQLGAEMGKSESAVRAWCGGSTPRARAVAWLARRFSVPMDYFFVVRP